MAGERIALIDPTGELEASFRSMAAEYADAGEDRYQDIPALGRGDFPGYVRKLQGHADGIDLESGWVPWSTYWLVRDPRRILGVSRLRHRLNGRLLVTGGHIGYDIRPAERGKGYGTRILAMTLEKARARAIRRALLTCLAGNAASARVIEKNGGVLQDVIDSEEMGGPLKRYWIDL